MDTLWFAVIGFFLVLASGAESDQQQVVSALTGVSVGELMSRPPITIPARLTLALAQPYFANYRYTAFPVIDDADHALGLLTTSELYRVPRSRWAVTSVDERTDRHPGLLIGEHEDVARLLTRPAFARVGRAVVVDDDRHPVGIISVTDIQRSIRVARLDEPGRRALGSRADDVQHAGAAQRGRARP